MLGFVCFIFGMMIEMLKGVCLIEDLQEGDIVYIVDVGLQWVCMVCCRVCDVSGFFVLICIVKGVIGNCCDFLVSLQYCVQLIGWVVEFYFGEDEVLIVVKYLVNVLKGVIVEYGCIVEYIYVILDGYYLLIIEGVVIESFDIGGDFVFYDLIICCEFEGCYFG